MIHLNQDASSEGTFRTFEVRGVPFAVLSELSLHAPSQARWQSIFSVFVGHVTLTTDSQVLPMLGTYRVEEGLIRFSPRYPLLEGQAYTAVLDLGPPRISAFFDIPRPPAPPARVTHIYPSAAVLPEDLLRFYIYFSAPMREGEALKHVHLLGEGGQEVQGVFLDPREELWAPTMTRLTLLLDPGRVKSGLGAHGQLGRALCAGERYRLVVDQTFRDARGEALESSFEKRFLVASAGGAPPAVSRWTLAAPRARTRAPLTVRFPAPLDHALLASSVSIRAPHAGELAGEITLDQEETALRFHPREPWEPGRYSLDVDGRLEDVAGNNLYGLFDRPACQKQDLIAGETASLAFQVE